MDRIDWKSIVKNAVGTIDESSLPATVDLPALPHAVALFMQKANDPDASTAELAHTIETDTALTAELLRYVNSSSVGLRGRAKTVKHALTLLGRRRAKMHIVTTAARAAVRARKSRLIHQGNFWTASLQKALFAREVATLLKADADLAFCGALLQDYLLPVLSNKLYDIYLDFIAQRSRQPDSLSEFEEQHFGWNHALAGAALAVRWHLPPDLVSCILLHHTGVNILVDSQLGRSAVAAVALSALLPDQMQQQRDGLKQLAHLGNRWNAFDLERVAAAVDQSFLQIGITTAKERSLSRLCHSTVVEAAGVVPEESRCGGPFE